MNLKLQKEILLVVKKWNEDIEKGRDWTGVFLTLHKELEEKGFRPAAINHNLALLVERGLLIAPRETGSSYCGNIGITHAGYLELLTIFQKARYKFIRDITAWIAVFIAVVSIIFPFIKDVTAKRQKKACYVSAKSDDRSSTALVKETVELIYRDCLRKEGLSE